MPTAGGDEYDLWIAYTNRAIAEWANSHDWPSLIKTYYPTVTGLTQATTVLPDDFRKLAASPIHWGTGITGGETWDEALPNNKSEYLTTDKYVYILGDINDGHHLIWNPATLASGASLQVLYYSTPTSLASPAQVPVVPDSQFLVDRVIAYVFESRSDSRFQETEAKARDRLLAMIEQSDASLYSSWSSPYPVRNHLQKLKWRVGRDG